MLFFLPQDVVALDGAHRRKLCVWVTSTADQNNTSNDAIGKATGNGVTPEGDPEPEGKADALELLEAPTLPEVGSSYVLVTYRLVIYTSIHPYM